MLLSISRAGGSCSIREAQSINPEHVVYSIEKKDGSVLAAGWIAENANSVTFAQLDGRPLEIPLSEIASQKQLPLSLTPAGLDQALNAEQLRDLMSYLLIPPFEAAPLMISGAPPLRKMSEVESILGEKLKAPMDPKATPPQIPDESYWLLIGDLKEAKAEVLATSIEENEPRPQMWTREIGPGRVFVSIPGHYTWTFDDPLYRILLFRGMMWSAGEPIDRIAPLSLIGARVEEWSQNESAVPVSRDGARRSGERKITAPVYRNMVTRPRSWMRR